MSRISLPPKLEATLDGWGPCMRMAAEDARERFLRAGTGVSVRRPAGSPSGDMLGRTTLVLGTDCSGADTPVWALRSLWPGRFIDHAFACDTWSVAEKVIKANSACRTFVSDILRRAPGEIPSHNIYVCGFPCQPFSSLHHGTRLMREKTSGLL